MSIFRTVIGTGGIPMYKKKRGQDYYTNRHSCFLLQYHLVLVTKYRKPVLKGEVKELVYQIIRDIFKEKGLVILELNGESDHIHILYEADPFTAPRDACQCGQDQDQQVCKEEIWGYCFKGLLLEAIVLE